MNCHEFTIETVRVDLHRLKDTLLCVLHTIMFNRALGVVLPREGKSPHFDLTWVECADPRVDKHFEDKIAQLYPEVQKRVAAGGGEPQQLQLQLKFFELNHVTGLFSREEKNTWEQWTIHLEVSGGAQIGAAAQHLQLEQDLRDRMMYILQQVDQNKDHLPKVLPPKPVSASASVAGGSAAGVHSTAGAGSGSSTSASAGKDTVLGVTYNYEVVLPTFGSNGGFVGRFWDAISANNPSMA